jgi:hypothetical protein
MKKMKSFANLKKQKMISNSDYQDFYVATKQHAEEQIKSAKKFLKGIKDFIDKTYLTNY